MLEVAELRDHAPLHIEDGQPVRARATRVPEVVRRVLDDHTAPPTVTVSRDTSSPWVPGRNLWVLLLATSLLTGPLVESLPGERNQRTWETLRAAPLSTAELLTGKWLAWTLASVLVAGSGILAGLLGGTQALEPALLGVPAVLATVVALGLWLLRSVEDPAGAATIPVRTIPLALLLTGGAAVVLADTSPVLAAAVPLGGPLWWAAGGSAHPGALVAMGVVSVLTVAGLLGHAARTVDRPSNPTGGPFVGAVVALAAWSVGAFALLAPAGWAWVGGRTVTPGASASVAAGLGWLLLAAVLRFRQQGAAGPSARPTHTGGWWAVAAIGTVLGGLDHVLPELVDDTGMSGAWVGAPVGPLWAAIWCAASQEVLFRGLMRSHVGAVASGVVWILATRPADPLYGVVAAAALTWTALRYGVPKTAAAHALAVVGAWALGSGLSAF